MLKLFIFLSLFLTQISLKATDICYPSLFEAQKFTEDYKEKLDFCYEHLVHLEEVLKEERLALMKEANKRKDASVGIAKVYLSLIAFTGLSFSYSIMVSALEDRQKQKTGDKTLKWTQDPLRLQYLLDAFNKKTNSVFRMSTGSFANAHFMPVLVLGASAFVLILVSDSIGRKKTNEEVFQEIKFTCDEAGVTCKRISLKEFLKLEAFIHSSKEKIESLRKFQDSTL